MPASKYSFSLAAAHNNAAGLVNIEQITPSSGRRFYPPRTPGGFSPGELIGRADDIVVTVGYASFIWLFDTLTRYQYNYLIATYSTGGNSYSGKVTVRTLNAINAYANYNATIHIPPDPKPNYSIFEGVQIPFTRVVAI